MPHWSTAGPHSKVPTIKEGYFATFEKPLEIMRCRPSAWCPGGTPGRTVAAYNFFQKPLFVSTKSGSWKKCGVCLHFETSRWFKTTIWPSSRRFPGPSVPTCRNLRWWFARWALCSVPRWENLVGWSMRRLPVLNIVLVGCTALGSALPSKRLLYCQRCGSLDALALFEQLSLDEVSAFESARSFSAPCTSERSGSKSKVCPFHIISDVRF